MIRHIIINVSRETFILCIDFNFKICYTFYSLNIIFVTVQNLLRICEGIEQIHFVLQMN